MSDEWELVAAIFAIGRVEAMARVHRDVGLDGGDSHTVVACNAPVTQRGAGDAAGLAGPSLAHVTFEHEGLNDHFTKLRGQSFRSTTSLSAWCKSAKSAYMRFFGVRCLQMAQLRQV